MGKDWAQTFQFWGSPPSKTEMDRCNNAEVAVRKAISASTTLNALGLSVFVQGSYANGTNVRQDSDVDICVLYTDTFFTDYSHTPEINDEFLGFKGVGSEGYSYSKYKNDVEKALVSYFGRPSVRRGKKALDIRENTYRVDADVVPCFEHRLYGGNRQDYWCLKGTELHPDTGGRIVNWPKQNKDNGLVKDTDTLGEFKAITRVLKNLRYEMLDDKEETAEKISSYLIECLAYLTPNDRLMGLSRYESVRSTIAWLWSNTKNDQLCQDWTEVNNIKYLFRLGQPWQRDQVHAFLLAAWQYIGFA